MSRRRFLRACRASGSTRRLVDRIMARGWRPGMKWKALLQKPAGGRGVVERA